MITDAQLRCSQAQSLAGAAATTVSTNVIDLLSAGRNLGRGQPMRAIVSIDVAFTGGTSMQPQMIMATAANMASPTVIASIGALADAALTAGKIVWDFQLPDDTQRFIAFQFVTVGTHTTGALSAYLVSDSDYNPYPVSNTGY